MADPGRNVWSPPRARKSEPILIFRHDYMAFVASLASTVPVGSKSVVWASATSLAGLAIMGCFHTGMAAACVFASTATHLFDCNISVSDQFLFDRSVHSLLLSVSGCGMVGNRSRTLDRRKFGSCIGDGQTRGCHDSFYRHASCGMGERRPPNNFRLADRNAGPLDSNARMDGTVGVRLYQGHISLSGQFHTYLAASLIESNMAGLATCYRGFGVECLDVERIAIVGHCGTSWVADFGSYLDVFDSTSSDR